MMRSWNAGRFRLNQNKDASPCTTISLRSSSTETGRLATSAADVFLLQQLCFMLSDSVVIHLFSVHFHMHTAFCFLRICVRKCFRLLRAASGPQKQANIMVKVRSDIHVWHDLRSRHFLHLHHSGCFCGICIYVAVLVLAMAEPRVSFRLDALESSFLLDSR